MKLLKNYFKVLRVCLILCDKKFFLFIKISPTRLRVASVLGYKTTPTPFLISHSFYKTLACFLIQYDHYSLVHILETSTKMAATLSMLESNYEADKLTYEIFSILENKFLFQNNDPHFCLPKHSALPLQNLNSGQHLTGKVRILSIDGAGSTDGLLAALSLAHLESNLQQKYQNPNARIAHFFDVVAGAGAGGVLAALLFTAGKDGEPMFSAQEAVNFMVENRRKISRSSPEGFFRRVFKSSENVYGKTFGDLSLKDTMKALLVPCYDLNSSGPFVFSRADALELDGYDFTIKDMCAATSAVRSVGVKSVDRKTKITAIGGEVAMNNPTAVAITHVLNNKQEFPFCNGVDDLLVVSLGNGESFSSGVAGNGTPLRSAVVKIAGDGAADMVRAFHIVVCVFYILNLKL